MSSDAVQDGEDVVIERDGAKVVVDQTSLDFIKGNFNEHLFVGWWDKNNKSSGFSLHQKELKADLRDGKNFHNELVFYKIPLHPTLVVI